MEEKDQWVFTVNPLKRKARVLFFYRPQERVLSKGASYSKKKKALTSSHLKWGLRYHQQNLTGVDQHDSRIPKMYCMKSWQIGRGRAVLARTADSTQFWWIGSEQPFHAIFAPRYIGFVSGTRDSIKNYLRYCDLNHTSL